MSASACSATLMLLAPGALTTTMPRAVAAADVDVVDAGAGARDDAQVRRGGQQARVDLRGAADEQRVGVGEIGGRDRRRSGRCGVYGPAGLGAEQLQRGGRQVVSDDNFQWEFTP